VSRGNAEVTPSHIETALEVVVENLPQKREISRILPQGKTSKNYIVHSTLIS
jgi:hypothetical protein